MKVIKSVKSIEMDIFKKAEPLRNWISFTKDGTFVFQNVNYVQGMKFVEYKKIFSTVYYSSVTLIYGIEYAL